MEATTPDEAERARAAVAVACLAWLRCSGPAAPPAEAPDRRSRMTLDPSPPLPGSGGHPLWDRWLDG